MSQSQFPRTQMQWIGLSEDDPINISLNSDEQQVFVANDVSTWPRPFLLWFVYLSAVHGMFWTLVILIAFGWKP